MGNRMNHCHDGNVKTNQWLTPPPIIKSLGEFDLDPASPIVRPWDTAKHHFNMIDDGLAQEWFGRVWLNPPYDSKTLDLWMEKMADHNNGVSLLFARTDRNTFHNFIFPRADSILFIKQRLVFYDVEGKKAAANGGAPSVLIGYGEENSVAIAESGIQGHHQPLNRMSILIVSCDHHPWRILIKTAMVRLSEATVEEVYKEVEKMAPDKVRRNANYRAKIRQQLQIHANRIKKGVYKKS